MYTCYTSKKIVIELFVKRYILKSWSQFKVYSYLTGLSIWFKENKWGAKN